jgi:hypothetical protein
MYFINDFDTDGDVDLYLTNPMDSNALYVNQGSGTFAAQDE